MRLYIDMDGTITEFKKLAKLEDLYEEGYFLNLRPLNTVNGIKHLIKEHPELDVYILSAVLTDSKYAMSEKKAWLDKHLAEIPKEKRIFTACGLPKNMFIDNIRKDDFLLDDYTKNLLEWEKDGGTGIKLLNGINHTKKTWQGYMVDSELSEFEKILYAIPHVE